MASEVNSFYTKLPNSPDGTLGVKNTGCCVFIFEFFSMMQNKLMKF